MSRTVTVEFYIEGLDRMSDRALVAAFNRVLQHSTAVEAIEDGLASRADDEDDFMISAQVLDVD